MDVEVVLVGLWGAGITHQFHFRLFNSHCKDLVLVVVHTVAFLSIAKDENSYFLLKAL